MTETSLSKTPVPAPDLEYSWSDYACSIYRSIEPIADTWDALLDNRDIFLSSRYLYGAEKYPPVGMQYFYALVRREDYVGAIYLQLSHFNARRSLNYERVNGALKGGRIGKTIKQFVAGQIDFYTLVCGNTLVTGSHGYYFDDTLDEESQLMIIDGVLEQVKEFATNEGLNVRLIFIKDFFDPKFSGLSNKNLCNQYNKFSAQPNMIMPIDPAWQDFGDYLAALLSKYRVRARRARKKCAGIVKRDMDLGALDTERNTLHELYSRIAEKASFNLFELSPGYFYGLQKHLGDTFKVVGYYDEGKLIAFFSLVKNNQTVEAHFLGYASDVNQEKQIYLNMLLDMIDIAIKARCDTIVFARTAMEIKSSVGAIGHDMYFYLQHDQAFKNVLLPRFYNLLDPKSQWVARSPFRSDQASQDGPA